VREVRAPPRYGAAMPEELLISGAIILAVLVAMWAFFRLRRRKRRRFWRSDRPINVKVGKE